MGKRLDVNWVNHLGVILFLALTGACTPTHQPSKSIDDLDQLVGFSPTTAADLTGTSWTLEQYGPIDKPVLVSSEPEVTLRFGPDLRMGGLAGCNTYAARFELDGYRFAHTDFAQTPFGCPDELSWAQEIQFMQALTSARAIGLKEDRLAISYDGGQLLFASRPSPPYNRLEGTSWSLIFFQKETGNQPLIPGSQITAKFKDGKIVGSTGCNEYTGAYATEASAFTMWQVVMTVEACPEDELRAQEASYMTALHSAHSFTIAHHTLTVAYDGGALRFGTMPTTAQTELAGTAWQLSATTVSGNIQPLLEGALITVAFDGERVYGSSGCNQFEASYQEEKTRAITIGQLRATQRDCGQIMMRQESDFLRLLKQVESLDIGDADPQLKLVAAGAELLFVPQSIPTSSTARPSTGPQPTS